MITREEAVTVLEHLSTNEALNEGLQFALQSIAACIDFENVGVHVWGADTDDLENGADGNEEAMDKYIFVPSDFEEADIAANIEALTADVLSEATEAPQGDEDPEKDK